MEIGNGRGTFTIILHYRTHHCRFMTALYLYMKFVNRNSTGELTKIKYKQYIHYYYSTVVDKHITLPIPLHMYLWASAAPLQIKKKHGLYWIFRQTSNKKTVCLDFLHRGVVQIVAWRGNAENYRLDLCEAMGSHSYGGRNESNNHFHIEQNLICRKLMKSHTIISLDAEVIMGWIASNESRNWSDWWIFDGRLGH